MTAVSSAMRCGRLISPTSFSGYHHNGLPHATTLAHARPLLPLTLFALILSIFATTSAWAASAADRVEFPADDQGRPLRLYARPERIVSLAPHATEMLFAAGAGGRVVAIDPASDHPAAAVGLPRVSAWPRPDLEALRGAAPDLILLWGAGLRAEQRESVERVAPVWVTEPTRLDEIPQTLRKLGRIAGDPGVAHAQAEQFSERLATLRAAVPDGPPVRVFYQAWGRPLITVSNRDLIGDAIRTCGGENVFGGERAAARQVDPEAVRAARPQLVVLGDGSTADAPGGEPLARWRGRWIGRPPALVAIAPELLQRPTPRVLEGVDRLCLAIRETVRGAQPSQWRQSSGSLRSP